MHPEVPVPALHAARLRIRVDATDAVTELRNVVADRERALAADGQQWRSLQAAQPPPASVRASSSSVPETAALASNALFHTAPPQ